MEAVAATEAMAVEEEVAVEEAVVGVGEAMAVAAVTPMAEAEVAEAMMMMKIPRKGVATSNGIL